MSLLPDKIRRHMKNALKYGQKGHAHPFQWNEELDRPELCRSKRGRLLWRVNSTVGVIYFFFILVQNIRIHLDGESSNVIKIYMGFVILNTIMILVTHVANVTKQNELPGFFQQFSTIMKGFQGQNEKGGKNQTV